MTTFGDKALTNENPQNLKAFKTPFLTHTTCKNAERARASQLKTSNSVTVSFLATVTRCIRDRWVWPGRESEPEGQL